MKTIEQLYEEIKVNDELKAAFSAALKENKVEEFAKAHECEASAADIMAYIQSIKSGELSVDDLENVAGGVCTSFSCNVTCVCSFGCY